MARFHVSTGHISLMPKACNYLFSVIYYKFVRERKKKQSEIVCILTSLTICVLANFAYAFVIRPQGYKMFFMLNSTEHEISTALKTKLPTNKEVSSFKSLRCCIYHANKC